MIAFRSYTQRRPLSILTILLDLHRWKYITLWIELDKLIETTIFHNCYPRFRCYSIIIIVECGSFLFEIRDIRSITLFTLQREKYIINIYFFGPRPRPEPNIRPSCSVIYLTISARRGVYIFPTTRYDIVLFKQ